MLRFSLLILHLSLVAGVAYANDEGDGCGWLARTMSAAEAIYDFFIPPVVKQKPSDPINAFNGVDAAIESASSHGDQIRNYVGRQISGWELRLKRASPLPVEFIVEHASRSNGALDATMVRVWVATPDLGNANVNVHYSGRVEISLSSVMNQYTATRYYGWHVELSKRAYEEILAKVSDTNPEVKLIIADLNSAGKIRIDNYGIVISPKDQGTVSIEAKKLTQAVVDFLQREHPDATQGRLHKIRVLFSARPTNKSPQFF